VSILVRVVAFASFLMAAPTATLAQAPVPTVQPEATSIVTGSLSDSAGAAINHATITAINQDTGASISSSVTSSGKFSLRVPAGSYQLNVKAPGFSEYTHDLTISPGSAPTLNFVLGGPVPVVQSHPDIATGAPGSTHKPDIVSSDVTVQSCSASTKSDLVDCIGTSADGHRLLGVIGGDTGTAYFIWLRDPSARATDIHISDPIALPSTTAIRGAFPKNATDFCGSFKTSAGYLLFYR
jgi:hypothetical protein